MEFYPIKVQCPKCSQETVILSISFSIKGEIRYEVCCALCGINMEAFLTWEDTILYCSQQELIQRAIMPTIKTMQ